MKPNIRGGIFHLTKYVLIFSIILLLSCISTSAIRLEGDDFKKNLHGLWEGRPGPLVPTESGKEYLHIVSVLTEQKLIVGLLARYSPIF